MILEEVESIPKSYVVVEGIRGMDEIKYLREKLGWNFRVVELEAPPKTRLRRILGRARDEGRVEIKNPDDLLAREQREASYGFEDVLEAADCHISTYRMRRSRMPYVFTRLAEELWGD
jgi:dephospho-CoA kinase